MLFRRRPARTMTGLSILNISPEHTDLPKRAETMTSERKTAFVAGVLFITATVAGILGVLFVGPIPVAPEYMGRISANDLNVKIGALFESIMAFGCSVSSDSCPGNGHGDVAHCQGLQHIDNSLCSWSIFRVIKSKLRCG